MLTLLFATMFPQAVLSMMSLSPPVMASAITAAYGLPAELTGLYTGLVYVFILVGNLLSAPLIDRFGPLRLRFACAVVGGAGLLTSPRSCAASAGMPFVPTPPLAEVAGGTLMPEPSVTSGMVMSRAVALVQGAGSSA